MTGPAPYCGKSGTTCQLCNTSNPCKYGYCSSGKCKYNNQINGTSCSSGKFYQGSCCNGCRDKGNNTCKTLKNTSACGTQGADCQVCISNNPCKAADCSGSCVLVNKTNGTSCGSGNYCNNGQCSGSDAGSPP